ncbi:MAG TPA: hypothetical protein VF406_11795 [Thermodesulfobacteriota bacterium]
MPWPLILLTETPRTRRALRRFTWGARPGDLPQAGHAGCQAAKPWPDGYNPGHDAAVPIEDGIAEDYIENGRRYWRSSGEEVPRTDSRWPTTCRCGYVFAPDDQWQVAAERIYTRADTGAEVTLRDAPIGACWRAWWLEDVGGWSKPRYGALIARCPGGHDWTITGPASNGPGWIITGELPRITARPSIATPTYHLEGRRYAPA